MSEAPAATKPKSGGCLSKLSVLVFLAIVGGIVTGLFFMARPQDLSDLGGYGPAAHVAPVRDIEGDLKSSIEHERAITLTEADINQWLAKKIQTKQTGLLGNNATLERVWVRLEDGRIEVIMERKIFGAPFTSSMYLQIEQLQKARGVDTVIRMEGGPLFPGLPKPPRGGRFGQLVVPQGFLLLVMPSYEKLAALFPSERSLILRQMSRIKLEKGKLVLDPREPTGNNGLPDTF